MTDPIFLKNARFILTMDGDRILENASVRMEDGMISQVGDIDRERGDEVIDCSNSVIMPGMINAHTHAAMVLLRGLNDDAVLHEWLASIWEVEARITPNIEQLGAEMGFLEMIRTGTTGCVDMYGAFPGAKAAEKVGIRSAGGHPLISVFGSTDERLKVAKDFIDEYRGHERIYPIVNLHAIYTNDDDAMRRAASLSKKEDVMLHVHCAETRKETFENRRDKGRLALEELDEHGCVWEKTLLAHMGWASSWEFKLMKERGAKTVHCPVSNQKLATGGFFPYKDLKEMGAVVGLGTDGAASNNSLDMFREMRSMALLQKGQYWNAEACSAEDALLCSTVNGYNIMGICGGKVGEGMNADLAVLDIDPMMMPLRRDNLMSALVYSATGNQVRGTFVHGEPVYLDGKVRGGEDWREIYLALSEETEGEIGL